MGAKSIDIHVCVLKAAMLIAQMQGTRKAGDVWGSPTWTMAS